MCNINILQREGNFYNLSYKTKKRQIEKMTPTPKQLKVVNAVKRLVADQNRAVVFVHGAPGSGKSILAALLAIDIDGTLCKTFNPCDPGDSLERMLEFMRDGSKPIILIDEVDTLLRKIHRETIERHKNIPIQIRDKASWNKFLDDMIFHKIIIIMTSNISRKKIAAELDGDGSYLRDGRVDASFRLKLIERSCDD
jgi:hypothetical protein